MKEASVSRSYAKVLFDMAINAKKLTVVSNDIKALGLLCKKMKKCFLCTPFHCEYNLWLSRRLCIKYVWYVFACVVCLS